MGGSPPTGPVGAADAVFQPITLMQPMRGGFAANVNVMSQPFGGTAEAYLVTSLAQAEAMNWTVLASGHSETGCVFEATGTMGARQLHWYARAVMQGERVILATATALESRWEEDGPGLRASVDSLALLPAN